MEIAFQQSSEWLRMNESHDSPPIGSMDDTPLFVSLSPLSLPSIEPPCQHLHHPLYGRRHSLPERFCQWYRRPSTFVRAIVGVRTLHGSKTMKLAGSAWHDQALPGVAPLRLPLLTTGAPL